VINLAYRDIRFSLGRFALTCLGLSLLLGVVLSMIGIYRGLVEDALRLARTPGADIWVVEAGRKGPFAESSRIPGATREMIASFSGVAEAGAVTYQSVETLHRGMKLRLYIVGYEPGRLGGPKGIVRGRHISRSHFEMVADRRTGLSPGERVRLGRHTFTVVGITSDQVASGGDPVAYLTLKDSQVLQFEPEPAVARREAASGSPPAEKDIVNGVVARLSPGIAPARTASSMLRWKHLAVLTQEEQEKLLLTSVVEKSRKQIGLFTVILITVSAVIIALIIYTMTMDKVREIATLKLIGAPDRVIVGLIVKEALLMALVGFGLGAALVNLVKDRFPRRVLLQPEDGLLLGCIVIVVCLLASGMGVRLALRIDPAEALGG
jgi:putative ABC transport system permease protein